MIKWLKHFDDSLNIVVILAPGRGYLSAKCSQSPLTLMEYN